MAEVKHYKALGESGLRHMSGYVYEEFLPNLRWPWAEKVYKEMADNDPVVGAILYLAEMLFRKVEWTAKPASDSAEDKEAAEFIKECMDDMDQSWNDTMSEILSMLTYGFSFHEIVYKVRRGPEETNRKYRSAYSDGKIGWRKLPIRAQSSLSHWEISDEGEVEAFVQQTLTTNVRIPMTKGLLFRTRVSKNNPEGKSLLRNAYRPWYFKKRIEEIEGIGIERDLAGLPVLTAPEGIDLWNSEDPRNTQLRANAEALVQSVRRDAEEGLLLPYGWDFQLMSTGSSRQFDTNAIIARYDNRIAITMLSDLVLIGGEKTGSFALAEAKQSILATSLEAQLENISTVFNKQAVPRLLAINGMKGKANIVPGEIEAPGIKEIALLLRSMDLNIAGDKDLMNYLRKIASFPEMDDELFETVYKPKPEDQVSAEPGKPGEKRADEGNGQDTVDNEFEQNDLDYNREADL